MPAIPRQAVLELATALLERPSVTPDDGGCQAIIAERLGRAGFRCEAMPFGDVSNLWARIGDQAPLLCLAGHTDVVPPGDLDEWQSDPFTAIVKNGALFGRGAADMKGSIAAMVVAAEQFLQAHPDFGGSLAFLITSDEEGPAVDGTKKVIEQVTARGERIDWCIVGEPSSDRVLGDCIRIGRRGSLTGALRVRGVQGHVAYAHLASNPARLFTPALAELLTTEWDSGNDSFPATSFEVVHLECGTGADNVIPFELNTRFNFRYSTQWNAETLATKVEAMLRAHRLDFELEWILSGEPFLTPAGRLRSAVSRAVEETVGVRPAPSTGGGTSDGRFIAPTGAEVIELGPCNASIHKVNESVSVEDLGNLATIYHRSMELLLLP